MNFTRRNFLQSLGAGAALSVMGFPFLASAAPSAKVVILGAGFGGSTTAKYLKMLAPGLNVTLIDRASAHTSCVLSNEVVAGLQNISHITLPHKAIADKYGVKFVQAEVQGLDAKKKTVKTSAGSFSYDKLVVAPGISMDYDEKNGFDAAMQAAIPHAWIGGPQITRLAGMLENVKKGGTVLVRVPKAIYRCPPGPYERICLLSDMAKRRGFKVIALDSNPQIVSKGPLFKAAFEELYKDVLTYIPGTAIRSFDMAKKALVTDKGDFTADVMNFIADQKAGELAFRLGLVPKGGRWAPVSPVNFESEVFKDVYVIGDAIDSSITQMPKSGTIANGMGKLLAENLLRDFTGKAPVPPLIGNSCYSLVSGDEGIYIATVYKYDPKVNRIVIRNGTNAIAPSRSEENFRNQSSWGANILADSFY